MLASTVQFSNNDQSPPTCWGSGVISPRKRNLVPSGPNSAPGTRTAPPRPFHTPKGQY
ncbi:hypothetical protein GCM10027168_74810 [Streptomyces capparidis]